MAISVIGAASTAAPAPIYLNTIGGARRYAVALDAGYWEIAYYGTNLGATPANGLATFVLASGANQSFGFADPDTGSSAGPLIAYQTLTEATTYLSGNFTGLFRFTKLTQVVLSAFQTAGSVTTITTTGSVTLPANNEIWLCGGGGGGAGSYSTTPGTGGGGSGYWTSGSLAAGTYTATIGAGGALGNPTTAGGRGGTTSIGTLSAVGGFGSTSGAGGAGGSGGGGAGPGGGASGTGGSNGSNGVGGVNPGAGAGVPIPAFVPSVGAGGASITSGNGSYGCGGGGGGAYGAGGAGRYTDNGIAAGNNTGGGGGGTGWMGTTGGAGGSGIIVYCVWS